MEKKKHGPKKGAAKKWSERLEKLGEQSPPDDLMKIINKIETPKKVAKPSKPANDMEI
jgi:hypothetical protein